MTFTDGNWLLHGRGLIVRDHLPRHVPDVDREFARGRSRRVSRTFVEPEALRHRPHDGGPLGVRLDSP